MPELTATDLQTYTSGRLSASDAGTTDLVNAALDSARRYCGWSVSPVTVCTITVDGPGGRALSLPTMNLITLTSVTEHGVTLDVTKLDVSRRKGTVTKHQCGHWSHRDGAITVTMTHGFNETEAADWRRAVLRLANLSSLEPTGDAERDSPEMKRRQVGDVDYQWYDKLITTDDRLASMFSQYRILPSP
jgi:hypothetical protein